MFVTKVDVLKNESHKKFHSNKIYSFNKAGFLIKLLSFTYINMHNVFFHTAHSISASDILWLIIRLYSSTCIQG